MYNLVDTHVHLMAGSALLLWRWKHPHPLSGDFRLDEYTHENDRHRDARFAVRGVVWIEADTPYTLDSGLDGVRAPIEECAFVSRYATGPNHGEGSVRPGYIVALIPWAPVPWGNGLAEYVSAVERATGSEFAKVKGFRFLLQDKPPGTMGQRGFVEGLKWLAANDYVFDWGVDLHSGGLWQFHESVEVFRQVPNVKYIINHMTKPNLELDPGTIDKDAEFVEWKRLMEDFHRLTPNSYMKLSGGFSELPDHLLKDKDAAVSALFPWFSVCFDLWGAERMIWASNWPVYGLFSGEGLSAQWFDITEALFDRADVSHADRLKIYTSNYAKAYNI